MNHRLEDKFYWFSNFSNIERDIYSELDHAQKFFPFFLFSKTSTNSPVGSSYTYNTYVHFHRKRMNPIYHQNFPPLSHPRAFALCYVYRKRSFIYSSLGKLTLSFIQFIPSYRLSIIFPTNLVNQFAACYFRVQTGLLYSFYENYFLILDSISISI